MRPWPADMDPVAALAAIEEIKQLKARYFRSLDIKDWAGLRAVFCEDAVIGPMESGFPHPIVPSGGTRALAPFVRDVSRVLADVVSVHHGHMAQIRLRSATDADGIWAMEDRLRYPPGSPVSALHGFGHYVETYRRDADGWRIATMQLSRLDVEVR